LKAEDHRGGPFVGWHRVTVEDLAIYAAPRSPDGTVTRLPPVRVAPHFADPLRSPLRQEVRPGTQSIELDLPVGS
jgi:hypothetical protein